MRTSTVMQKLGSGELGGAGAGVSGGTGGGAGAEGPWGGA